MILHFDKYNCWGECFHIPLSDTVIIRISAAFYHLELRYRIYKKSIEPCFNQITFHRSIMIQFKGTNYILLPYSFEMTI